MRHELVFIERITPEEFERQKGQFTDERVKELQNTPEYRRMRKEKGRAIENWNWQAYETKNGEESDISSEYDIISNYYDSGSDSDDVKSVTPQFGVPKRLKTALKSDCGDFE